jgi:hypothetical protein
MIVEVKRSNGLGIGEEPKVVSAARLATAQRSFVLTAIAIDPRLLFQRWHVVDVHG